MSEERKERLVSEGARRADALFVAALERPPEDRAAFVAERAGGNEALRREVEELLAAHEMADGILDAESSERARRVGPYRVLRELGRGGMGVVYLAERDDGQFRRRVAIKLLRASPDADELRRRFQAERQILASLAHPNIAQLLDGGVTDGQLPYLVMEYVEGLPITEYCERRGLGIRERLRLFRKACAAVHHAHRNLVIHRDLKPSNILVTADGQVKLLDFGIAKLLNPGISAMEMPVTRTEFRVMTPEYASPEQLRGEPLSTASDIYALGVVLYQLLAGRRPYAQSTGSPGVWAELLARGDPPRPSAVVTDEGLRRRLRGDLDAIVMMALRKEPNARYGSADLLAADLERHLEGLPVAAHQGSRRYRARKFLQRHRVEVAAAAAILVALVAGAGLALWQASVARSERDRAESARVEAERALAQSEEMAGFLMGLFQASDPERALGDTITARELLRRGRAQAEQLAAQPLVQARMLEVIGRVHLNLGDFEEAQSELERALAIREAAEGQTVAEGQTAAERALTLHHLAEVHRRRGAYAEAERASRRALELRREAFGDADPRVADGYYQLSGLAVYRADLAEAEAFARRALEIRRAALGSDDPEVATDIERLAAVLRRQGRAAEAEATFREALDIRERVLGRTDPSVGYLLLRLADVVSQERENVAEGEALYRRGIDILRASLGPEHPRVAWALGDLAGLLSDEGRHREAEALLREAVSIIDGVYGPDHPFAAAIRGGLADALLAAGAHEEAWALREDQAARYEAVYGRAHTAYTSVLGGMARVRLAQGRLDEAEALIRESIRIRREEMGESDTPLLGNTLVDLARVQAARGDRQAADSLYRSALEMILAHTAPTHRDARTIYRELAALHEAWGRPDQAREYRALASADNPPHDAP